MVKVIIKKSTYSYEELKQNITSILDSLNTGLIKEGTRVLIKPNFLLAYPPDKAVTTHPLVVKAIAEYVLNLGASVQISDSSGSPTNIFNQILKVGGYQDALKGLDVTFKDFTRSVMVNTASSFKNIEIAEDALKAEVIINAAKLKTHTQMRLTLAVKNLFGTIVGLKKPQWHMKVGENREKFAELLVTLYSLLKPQINILDGILAMEGDGPGSSGIPRNMGVLMGSSDAVTLDMAVCEMLNIAPLWLYTNKAALKLDLIKDYTIEGEMDEVTGFVFPKETSMLFGPPVARKFMRKHLTTRPKNVDGACKLCNSCVKICPAQAITNDGKKLIFNYEKCIRCYCCQEICPHKAIEIYEPLMGKTIMKMFSK
ncbi:MAG: DUF362 domain-containing protein [Nitrospirae bacterium]|nr:DUF362 domain-containing protein [Nitrospirota bacterium]MBF0536226.1 DUF362 domain-containing protein [Nitrospirota bacterium]MBF0617333.1 DUF362 domain-containing protein [Nitrospirota bacterium]